MFSSDKCTFLTIVFLCSSSVFVTATEFINCTSGKPPISLDVKGCKNSPCNVYRGQDAIMKMDFEVDHDIDQLEPSVKAHIPGSVVPYPLPQPNACLGLINGECPLDNGEEVTYVLQMPILKSFPKIKVSIEFNLMDEKKNVIVCFKLGAEVVDN